MARVRGLAPTRVLLGLAVALLAGCAGFGARPTAPAAPAGPEAHARHAEAVRALERFRLAGRIGVQREDKGFSADLDWRELPPGYALRLSAPLSGGTYALSDEGAGVVLAAPKGKTYRAADAQALMREHLGWSLPLDGARYWVRGVPDPARPVSGEHLDEAGRWTDFAQDGWRVSVLEYAPAAGLDLPRRLFLVRDKLSVRMAIKTWERR
ncbi:MAG: lipoprotein insertase outer membrane protein LolB [Gammaproteobacteria bacterium]